MTQQNWYSATLRFYSLSSANGRIGGEESVFLVQAIDFDHAFEKFLEVGRQRETSFENYLGHEVRVKFIEIAFLDMIQSETLDGAEVTSKLLTQEDPSFTFDTPVDPAKSQPEHTGI